jgi:quinol monooxygenase YgiN
MSDDVYWMLELEVQPGRERALEALMAEMVGATKAGEPGTLNYEWSMSADGKVCHLHERYTDSAALMTHVAAFGEKYAPRFLEALKPVRFVVYGAPTQEVKDALAGFNPVYMRAAAGFRR